MQLCIQDPSYDNSFYLHESLLTACQSNTSGGGAYAFASQSGIDLLLGDNVFKSFLENGYFYLVVGMDDITNIQALKALKKYQDQYKKHLTVKVYIHQKHSSTFHPKYSWFKNDNGGTLVIGSGNLTQNGLRKNREAYTIIDADKATIDGIVSDWNKWLSHSKPFLFDVDDLVAIKTAGQNSKKAKERSLAENRISPLSKEDTTLLKNIFYSQPKNIFSKKNKKNLTVKGAKRQSDLVFDPDEQEYWRFSSNSSVLIAEIPKSGDRWKQVNFDKDTFENFFGATCGDNGTYRVLLKNVDKNGLLKSTEIRPSVSVASHNYRFELDAATGLPYPNSGERPIAVFVKTAPRDFLYALYMPGDECYKELVQVLSAEDRAKQKVRREVFKCSHLRKSVPSLKIWDYELVGDK